MIPHVVFALAYAVIFAAYQLSNKTTWVDIVPSLFIFVFLLMSFDAVRPLHTMGLLNLTSSPHTRHQLIPRRLECSSRRRPLFASRPAVCKKDNAS
jgi:hypothetical protein